MIAAVISSGLATYIDCRDRLSIDEVADLNELLVVKHENERRAQADAERRRKRG